MSKVALVFKSGMGKEQEVRDDGGGGSCADCNVEQVQTQWYPTKVVVTCEVGEACCRKDKEVVTFDSVSARGAKDEGVKGRVSSNWEEVSVEGPLAQGSSFLGQVMELDVERRPNCSEEGQTSGASKDPLEVGRPMSEFLKGPTMVGQSSAKALKGARARGGLRDPNCGRPDGDDFGIQMGSPPPVPNHAEITDEALLEEASRYTDYPPCSLFSLGKLDFFSSSTPSGQDGAIVTTDGGSERGCVSKAVEVAGLGPLRVILADKREAEISRLSGKAQGAVEEVTEDVSKKVIQEVVEERDEAGDPS